MNTTTHTSQASRLSDADADLPLIGVVPFGLPCVLLLAGWTFLALALAGPFLVLVTIVAASMVLVAITAVVVAVPYLIARSLHRYWTGRASRSTRSLEVGERQPSDETFPTRRRGARVINRPAAQLPVTASLHTAAHLVRNP
jgi:hypothetical protein